MLRSLLARPWRLGRSQLALVAQGAGDQQLGRLAWLALLGAGLGVSGAHAAEENSPPPGAEKGWHVMSIDQRRRVFFKYEKRIREMSPQEKVFDYFASQYDPSGRSFMLPGDMLRSVVPVYPPDGSPYIRSGSLAGEPNPEAPVEESEFFRQFDLDGDGRINFDEYLLFTTLLAIPSEDIEVAFKILDTDGSGAIDAREFGKLLEALHRRAAQPQATNRNLVHSSSEQERLGLMLRFFGRDGQGQLSLKEFSSFIALLRRELVRLEFLYYNYDNKGYMTGRDFAHSIVGCASPKFIDDYMNKVQQMPPELANAKVTLADLQAFREVWRQLRLLSVALEFIQNTSGVVRPEDFAWVVEHVLHTKVTPAQVAVVFYLFGTPERGLNVHYLNKTMSRHHATGMKIVYDFQREAGKPSVLDCVRECYAR